MTCSQHKRVGEFLGLRHRGSNVCYSRYTLFLLKSAGRSVLSRRSNIRTVNHILKPLKSGKGQPDKIQKILQSGNVPGLINKLSIIPKCAEDK